MRKLVPLPLPPALFTTTTIKLRRHLDSVSTPQLHRPFHPLPEPVTVVALAVGCGDHEDHVGLGPEVPAVVEAQDVQDGQWDGEDSAGNAGLVGRSEWVIMSEGEATMLALERIDAHRR